ncbi:MAG: hypothetical protein MUP14_00390 [Dehalococcoidia bacterium]|nr:hypothetical protein [Dehalococcoidia bacterium]
MPKRPRPGGRRFVPRQRPKERRQSEPGEATPARGVTPARIPEAPRRAAVPAGGFSVATTPTKSAARHIVKDYGYVLGELRRIMIVLLVIVAGLVAAAVALR